MEVPIGLLANYVTVNLDPLDQALIDILQDRKTFSEIVQLSKELFEDEQMGTDFEAFVLLIKQRLKEGIEKNLFEIAE